MIMYLLGVLALAQAPIEPSPSLQAAAVEQVQKADEVGAETLEILNLVRAMEGLPLLPTPEEVVPVEDMSLPAPDPVELLGESEQEQE